MQLDIVVSGDTIVSRKLVRFADRAMDLSPAWPQVKKQLQTAFQRNFDQQGPSWPHLKASTIRQRIAQGYSPGPILNKTGAYKRGSTAGLVTHGTTSELIALVPSIPGVFHQKGTRTPMPARPLKLRENEKREIVKTVQRVLIEGYSEHN